MEAGHCGVVEMLKVKVAIRGSDRLDGYEFGFVEARMSRKWIVSFSRKAETRRQDRRVGAHAEP
jgi:hypothetical protein